MSTSIKLLNNRNNALGELITCARNLRGLTQLKLSKKLDISLSTLSRIESGKMTPDIFLWYEISQALQIPMDSIRTTFLNYQEVSSIRENLSQSWVSIPSDYTQNSCFKLRKLTPYFSFVCDHFGWQSLLTWLKKAKIPSYFLSCLDLEVNLVFYCELIRFLMDDLEVSYDQISSISHYVRVPELHGDNIIHFNSKKSGLDLIELYVQKSHMYQKFFYYDILERTQTSLILECTLNPCLHDEIHHCDPDGLSFLEDMREEKLKMLSLGLLNSKYQLKEPVRIEELNSIYRGDPTTLYHIQCSGGD